MHPLSTYLEALLVVRDSRGGLGETSSYRALENLLDEVGRTLRPRVRCVAQLRDLGAGCPDAGLFAEGQLAGGEAAADAWGQAPERGVVEIKPTGDDAWLTAAGDPVSRYWDRYRQVLVTNYRDFVVLGRDAQDRPITLDAYRLAADEAAFWAAARHPRRVAADQGAAFLDFLRRALQHACPIERPRELAFFLASYAREARSRLDTHAELPGLAELRAALEDGLGIRFAGEKGEAFFRSTLVQTLFYGVFAAWVLWHKANPQAPSLAFNWRAAGWDLRVPVLGTLFEHAGARARLQPLGLVELLDRTAAVLARVERTVFFSVFEEDRAVQYFYEPFLEAFDPALRRQLGVWYTPHEVVRYMVERAHRALIDELGIADGLADERVHVLDPCCGTGAYLVEVLRRIRAQASESRGEGPLLAAAAARRAALERVHGFEILPAPFVIAHLRIGLELWDAPLAEPERARVYLTNALCGWEPSAREQQPPLPHEFAAHLAAEGAAAARVKRRTPILVVIGNPPYNAFAGVSAEEEGDAVAVYKQGLAAEWNVGKFNLDDLYVRFFRLAERRIVEGTGRGVVCFISNYSYLSDPSFVVLRQRFLAGFDRLWFDCLNGDSRETGKRTPDGMPDPSVFSTEHNREGIRVGTAIALLVRRGARARRPVVRFRHFWGEAKRADLLASLRARRLDASYEEAQPERANRFCFRPMQVSRAYLGWPRLLDLAAVAPSNGLMEKRGGALIDIDRAALERRMRMYFDRQVSWAELEALGTGLTRNAAGFDARAVREKVLQAAGFDPAQLCRYVVRPFEVRWCYYCAVSPLWNRARPTLRNQCWPGNGFLVSRAVHASDEGVPFYFVRALADDHLLAPDASCFPLRLRPAREPGELAFAAGAETANLSPAARAYLARLGIARPDASEETAGLLWMHALAIGYSPAYRLRNADGHCQDWPRVPLPESRRALAASAALGRQVAALLDTLSEVPGVTSGAIRPELRAIGVPARLGSAPPGAEAHALTAGWGHRGKDGTVMPGRGRLVERPYGAEELAAFGSGSSRQAAVARLGETTCDVYLNDGEYWRNVPRAVWTFTIGGYAPVKKWLSYRERDVLGRPLSSDELREVMHVARRLAALRLLEPALDDNYLAIAEASFAWATAAGD